MAGNTVTGDLIIISYLKVITKIIKTLVKLLDQRKHFSIQTSGRKQKILKLNINNNS